MLELIRMKRTRNPPTWQRGFTLIELMVTISIAAILMMVAVPGMTAFKRNAELTSATNTLLAAITAARSEALKRGMSAMIVPTDAIDWNSGVVVFIDKDGDQAFTAANDITVLTQPALASYFTITPGPNTQTVGASSPYLMFNPSGFAQTRGGTVGVAAASTLQIARNDLTGAGLLDQTRRIMVAGTGRVRTCKPKSATDTTCLMSNPN